MAQTLIHKILAGHLVEGRLDPGGDITIRIDQTLTQDATGTTAFLLFESMKVPRVKTALSVSYVDHNTAGFGPQNRNDHLYLASCAAKYGVYHCRAGAGICHQVHLERFGRPGATLLGSDSHTPTGGALGMVAVGSGGMDVAAAMATGLFGLKCPKVMAVRLTGRLGEWVAAKDVILRLLAMLSVRGNAGWAIEYAGEGAATLSVPQRATITNMGAELGVTTSIFGCDGQTRDFLIAQGRERDWCCEDLRADPGAEYERTIELDLSGIEPMAACPSSPDNVKTVAEIAGEPVGQVIVGSCTNSSYADLMTVASVLGRRRVKKTVEFAVAPGSRRVLEMLGRAGALAGMISAGARILEPACGPCIGQGLSPAGGTTSLRTFNRNFPGRSGTPDDRVYLVSCETAAASAVTGVITDPRSLGIRPPQIEPPERFSGGDTLMDEPPDERRSAEAEVVRGPTIVVPPMPQKPPERLEGRVLIKCGDNITTDHIMPAGQFLKLRSNVPEYAKAVFNCFNRPGGQTFAERALRLREKGLAGIIVAGEGYGQGSSREHAALCPMYLGVRAVIVKGAERIHKANLINYCIVPIVFDRPADYDTVETGDDLKIDGLQDAIAGSERVKIREKGGRYEFAGRLDLSGRERKILLAGGLLDYTRGITGTRNAT
jgi:aconitate hydratase